MRIFIDGVQDVNVASAPVASIPINATDLYIACRDSLTYFFIGSIDEVRIYD